MASRIQGITIELNAKATPLVSALRSVQSQIRAMKSGLRDVDRLLKFSPTSTTLLTQKQQLLRQSILQTREKLRTLKQAMDEMRNSPGFDENSEDAQRLQREIIATEQELKRLESEYGRFASVSGAKMQAVGKKMQEVGRSISAVGTTLTQKVTMPLALAGGLAVKKFAEVDKTMQLTNATMGNTAKQAELLDSAMKEAAANSTFGMSDAATATLNFARAGLTAEQAAAALAPAMNLAAGEGGELDTVSAGLVATINGFHGSFNDAAHYADVFANACNNSALDVNSLSEAMSVAAPVFAAAGYSVDDAALYMGVMANNGIEASKAANSLKTGVSRLVKPTDEAAAWMDKLGFSITNTDGTMKDTITVQKELHDAFSQLSESEQIAAASAIFGKNQMAPWLALINTAPGDVDKLSKALGKEGTTAEMAASMMGGFGGALEKLKSSIDVAATSFGEALAPTISKIGDYIQKAVDWFNKLSKAQQQNIAKWALIAAAAGPVLVVLGKVITATGTVVSAFGKIKSAFAALELGAGPLSTALTAITGPIGIVIAAVGALAASFVYLYKTSEDFRNKVKAIWTQIKDIISTALKIIKTVIKAFVDVAKEIWARWGDEIKAVVKFVWDNILAKIKTVLTVIQGILKTVLAVLKGDWKGAWEAIKATFVSVWNTMRERVTATINAIKTIITGAWNAIKATTTAAWNGIKAGITAAWNGIKSGVSSATSAIKSITSSAWNGVKSITSSAWNTMKSGISAILGSMQAVISNAWNAIKNAASGAWNAIKNALLGPFQSAFNTISNLVGRIRGMFPIELGTLFHGTMANVVAQVKAAAGGGQKIESRVTGYTRFAKAYTNPFLFTSPALIGGALVGDRGSAYGGEVIYGRDNLMRDISEAANPISAQELYGIIVAALDKADMKVNISGREFGRIIREY